MIDLIPFQDRIMKDMDEDGVIDERMVELSLHAPSGAEEAERIISPLSAWDLDNVDLDANDDSDGEGGRRDSFPTMEQFEMQEAQAEPISQRTSIDEEDFSFDEDFEQYYLDEEEEELSFSPSSDDEEDDEENFVTIEEYEEAEKTGVETTTRRPSDDKEDENDEDKLRRMSEGRWMKDIKKESKRKDPQDSSFSAAEDLEVEGFMAVAPSVWVFCVGSQLLWSWKVWSFWILQLFVWDHLAYTS